MATIKNDPKAARILDFIAGPESKGNYNAYFGNTGSTKDLSAMTFDQVVSWSKDRGTPKSSATGRYQFMSYTLEDLKKSMGLSGSEKFTPELQDKMAVALLERRGYKDFAAGKITTEQFANNLAKEWASLPNFTTGRSHYAGDGLNKSLVGTDAVRAALEGTGAFPGARLATAAKAAVASTGVPQAGGKPSWRDRVASMFTRAPEPDPAPGPALDQRNEATLRVVERPVADTIRSAQAEVPHLHLAIQRGKEGTRVVAVDTKGKAINSPEVQNEVAAAIQRSSTQLGAGLQFAGGILSKAKTTRV